MVRVWSSAPTATVGRWSSARFGRPFPRRPVVMTAGSRTWIGGRSLPPMPQVGRPPPAVSFVAEGAQDGTGQPQRRSGIVFGRAAHRLQWRSAYSPGWPRSASRTGAGKPGTASTAPCRSASLLCSSGLKARYTGGIMSSSTTGRGTRLSREGSPGLKPPQRLGVRRVVSGHDRHGRRAHREQE